MARRFVNERRNVTINAASTEVVLSTIFKWYKADFENGSDGHQTVLDFARRYANNENRKLLDRLINPRIGHYDYDWSIDELGSRARAKSPLDRKLALVAKTLDR